MRERENGHRSLEVEWICWGLLQGEGRGEGVEDQRFIFQTLRIRRRRELQEAVACLFLAKTACLPLTLVAVCCRKRLLNLAQLTCILVVFFSTHTGIRAHTAVPARTAAANLSHSPMKLTASLH